MKTTGNSSVDLLFDTEASLKSSHVVVAEFNMNSYYEIAKLGCYTGAPSAVPQTYTASGWDNGNDKNAFGSDDIGNIYTDNDDRLKVSPLRECFKPNRPDAGLIHGVAINGYKDSTPGRIISNSNYTKQANFSNSETRLYPVSADSSFKYWNSYRSLDNANVGLSNSSLNISNANPFVVYSNSFKANKITIKTQKDKGYPNKFKIQYLNTSNNWVTAIDRSSSATTAGINGKIEISYNGTSWYFVSSSSSQSYLDQFSENTTQAVTMKGVRILVYGMSRQYIPLELIEISPRLVVNMTNHVMSFSISSSIGDSQYGLPLGSLVSSNGSMVLSNETRIFDKMNPDSIFTYVKDSSVANYELETMLRANVKFVFYQILINDLNEYAVPIKTMYSTQWSQASEFTTSVNLEDYIKFFRETQAPNLLIGYKNPLKSSLAIRMLLDNIGYNKFSFETKDGIDPEMNFFYSSNDFTVAEALNDIATSVQLSMFMDADNNFVVMTKDRISSRTAFDINSAEIRGKNYWFIGNQPVSSDAEYSYIDGKFSNIESISETSIPPVTDGTIQYKIINIKKEPTALAEEFDPVKRQELIDRASTSPTTVLTELSYVPGILWEATQSDSSQSVLISAILEKSMSKDGRPLKALSGKTIPAINEEDAIRKAFGTIYQNPGYTDDDLLINIDNDSAYLFLQSNKYEGYVYINNEVIKYNGILVSVTEPAKSYSRFIFNQDELESLRGTIPSGSKVLPKALIVYMNFKFVGKPTLSDSSFRYTIQSDGRAQNGTSAQKHVARSSSDFNDDWKHMSTIIADKKLDGLGNREASLSYTLNGNQSGYARLSGPSSLKKENQKPGAAVKNLQIDDYGQRFIHGYSNNLEAIPEAVGTRMRLVMTDGDPKKDTSSHIAGIAMHLTDSGIVGDGKYMSGYFLEVAPSRDGEATGNIRLYRMTTTSNTTECFVLGTARANISTTNFIGSISENSKSLKDGVTATIFELDLKCKVVNKKGSKFDLEFSVYWQGERLFKIIDKNASRLPRTNRIGMFVRDDSQAIYDHIYAYSDAENKITSSFEDSLGYRQMSVGKAVKMAAIGSQNNKKVYFEDFATMAREIKKFDVKFDSPTFTSSMIDFSSVSSDYLVKNYYPNAFGAKFWVYNTSNSTITLGEDSLTPLFISGIKLDYIADGEISLKKYIEDLEDNNEYDILQNRLYQNKQMYGDVSVGIASEYIATERQAEKMMQWIVKNASQERKELNISAFCNPLLELGDKVGVFYSDAGYSVDDIGNKTYVVAEINREVNEAGPTTSIVIRECP